MELLLAHWFQDLFWGNSWWKCIFHISNIIGHIQVIQEFLYWQGRHQASTLTEGYDLSPSRSKLSELFEMSSILSIRLRQWQHIWPFHRSKKNWFCNFLLWERRMIIMMTNKLDFFEKFLSWNLYKTFYFLLMSAYPSLSSLSNKWLNFLFLNISRGAICSLGL